MSNRTNPERQAQIPTCSKGTKAEGHPGMMIYEFDPPLSSEVTRKIVDAMPMFHAKGFPYELGTGFTREGTLHVSLALDTKWVDNFFGELNKTGLMEINMSLSPFRKAPKPVVDTRLPLLVLLEAGEQLTNGFSIAVERGSVRGRLNLCITGPDQNLRRKIELPEGVASSDIRVVTTDDNPDAVIMWMHDDGREYPIRKRDIPKAH